MKCLHNSHVSAVTIPISLIRSSGRDRWQLLAQPTFFQMCSQQTIRPLCFLLYSFCNSERDHRSTAGCALSTLWWINRNKVFYKARFTELLLKLPQEIYSLWCLIVAEVTSWRFTCGMTWAPCTFQPKRPRYWRLLSCELFGCFLLPSWLRKKEKKRKEN